MNFETKDSGKRQEYDSGMVRDLQDGKPDFYLCLAKDLPYNDQLLTRWAALMTRGKEKYGLRNWEKASSVEEMERFKSSAFRHMMQWLCGELDEDHAAAVCFNINAYEYVKARQDYMKEAQQCIQDCAQDVEVHYVDKPKDYAHRVLTRLGYLKN